MSSQPAEPPKIVVGVDFSETSSHTFRAAVAFADPNGERPLHVVHVIGHDPSAAEATSYASDATRELLDSERRRLDQFIEQGLSEQRAASPELRLTVVPHLCWGSPAKEIVRVAETVGADLVVVGTHRLSGVRRLILGSVAEEVLRISPFPVLVSRDKDWSKV
ncbi:MAG TPA: universal stress protein [Polyangiaceae bacterium]